MPPLHSPSLKVAVNILSWPCNMPGEEGRTKGKHGGMGICLLGKALGTGLAASRDWRREAEDYCCLYSVARKMA